VPGFHRLLARLLERRGDVAGAVVCAEMAVELRPGKAAFRRYLAKLYRRAGRHDDAAEQLRRADGSPAL